MDNMIKTLLTMPLILGLLAGCTQPNTHPMDMTIGIQNTKTKADHEALDAHYKQVAQEAEAKVEEQKKILNQYQAHSFLYGRQAQTLKENCESRIRHYQQVTEANLQMAKLHRELAKE